MPFSAKCSERTCLHDKGQCLNTAIKYPLLFTWQVNYVKTKQSTWWHIAFWFHIGIYVIVLAVRRRFRGKKNLLIQEPNTTYLALVIRFFKRLHTFNYYSLPAAVRDWTSWRRNTELVSCKSFLAISHNWRMWNSSLSRDLPWTLVLSLIVILGWELSH